MPFRPPKGTPIPRTLAVVAIVVVTGLIAWGIAELVSDEQSVSPSATPHAIDQQ